MRGDKAIFETAAALPEQLKPSTMPEIAFSGHSNVGKSSLINCLLGRHGLARTSATPGKTATINFYRVDNCRFVDLPGYGYAKVSNAEKKRWASLISGYFADDRDMRLVVQLIDSRHDMTKEDRQMIDFLVEGGFPFVVVLTKIDKLNKSERTKQLAFFEDTFAELEGLTVLPFSSEKGEGKEDLIALLEEALSD